jgi:hypothetical protein
VAAPGPRPSKSRTKVLLYVPKRVTGSSRPCRQHTVPAKQSTPQPTVSNYMQMLISSAPYPRRYRSQTAWPQKTIFGCRSSLRMLGSQEKTRRLGKAVASLANSSGRVLVCEALCHLDFPTSVRYCWIPRGGFRSLASVVNLVIVLASEP